MPKSKKDEVEEVEITLSILDLSAEEVDAAEGFHIVEDGAYEIGILKLFCTHSKAGAPMLEIHHKVIVDEDPMISSVRNYIVLPSRDLDPMMRKRRMFDLQQLLTSFQISTQEFVDRIMSQYADMMEGLEPGVIPEKELLVDYDDETGAASINVEEPDEEGIAQGWSTQNRIVKYLPPSG